MLKIFNAAGADDDGDIGEERNPETHLIPNIIKSVLNQMNLLFMVIHMIQMMELVLETMCM